MPIYGELELLPGLRLVPAPGHTRGLQVVVVETGGRPVVVGGDVAVRFGELDEPRTEGQLRVRALEPELVWLAHEHEPWQPRIVQGASQCIWPAVTYKWVVLSNTTIGTADRWQKRTGNEIEPPSH